MSRKSDCWDIMAESFFGSLKTETMYGKIYCTKEDAKRDLINDIKIFYNNRRRHSTLGYVYPDDCAKYMKLKEAA